MKRKGIKISIIILTVLSFISLSFSGDLLIEMVNGYNGPVLENPEGAVAALLFFFVIGAVMLLFIGGLLALSIINIILCSIDLNKSISNNDNVAFDIVFMGINFLFYVFVVSVVLCIIC